jgi:hypothetical protein
MARDTNGAESSGAEPAAARVRPVFLRNRRLVTGVISFALILGSSSVRFQLNEADPDEKIASSTGLSRQYRAAMLLLVTGLKPVNRCDLIALRAALVRFSRFDSFAVGYGSE